MLLAPLNVRTATCDWLWKTGKPIDFQLRAQEWSHEVMRDEGGGPAVGRRWDSMAGCDTGGGDPVGIKEGGAENETTVTASVDNTSEYCE